MLGPSVDRMRCRQKVKDMDWGCCKEAIAYGSSTSEEMSWGFRFIKNLLVKFLGSNYSILMGLSLVMRGEAWLKRRVDTLCSTADLSVKIRCLSLDEELFSTFLRFKHSPVSFRTPTLDI